MPQSKKLLEGKRWSFEPAGGKEPGPETAAPPPGARKAKIVLEKRPGGRIVTVVTGFALSVADRKSLAASIRKSCGAGGGDSPERIEVQGDHRGAVRDFLSDRGWSVNHAG